MAILDFSVSGWHGFGSVTQVCFGISVSNFMCMSFVAVGRSLTIVSYVAFKMAALWFWTMFNCNPPIAHCHPLLWGGGILIDHWSTISSSIRGMCSLLMIWYKDMGVSSVLHKTSFQKILQFWMCEIGHESFCNHYEIYKALKPWDMVFFSIVLLLWNLTGV